jgi:hypothetical protein
MQTATLAEALKASLTNSRCAICDKPAVNQFITHWAKPHGFAPAGFTCTSSECEAAVETYRDATGHLNI